MAREEKSLLEIANDLLKSKEKPQTIDDIIKDVMSLKGLKGIEAKEKKPQFVMDFMLSGNFVYCGLNEKGEEIWDLKYRQPLSVIDRDSNDYAEYLADNEEVTQNEMNDDNTFNTDDTFIDNHNADDDEDENKEDEDDLSNEFESDFSDDIELEEYIEEDEE